jgi:hypothetical protein
MGLVVHFVLGISVAVFGGRTDTNVLGLKVASDNPIQIQNKCSRERKSQLVTLPAAVDGNGSKDKKTLVPQPAHTSRLR